MATAKTKTEKKPGFCSRVKSSGCALLESAETLAFVVEDAANAALQYSSSLYNEEEVEKIKARRRSRWQ